MVSDTPRTHAIMAMVRKLDREALSHEYRIAMREGVECGIEQLERELAEARRDAERYRWLRDEAIHFVCHDGTDSPWVVLGKSAYECAPTCGGELDAAIDAAMKAE